MTSGAFEEDLVYPDELSHWMMIASDGAFHHPHVDSSGLGTAVHMSCGVKLWFIATALADGTSLDDVSEYSFRSLFQKSALEQIKEFQWELVVLNEGSTL